MSESATKDRLIGALQDLQDLISEEVEKDRKTQMRLRTTLIRALYWLDRYITEEYFRSRSEEKEKKESGKTLRRKRRGE